jgi:hypothetical protein
VRNEQAASYAARAYGYLTGRPGACIVGGEQRKAMADQLSTISKLRLRERLGRSSREDIAAVERAICVQLGI